jgi:hypothetical protein
MELHSAFHEDVLLAVTTVVGARTYNLSIRFYMYAACTYTIEKVMEKFFKI